MLRVTLFWASIAMQGVAIAEDAQQDIVQIHGKSLPLSCAEWKRNQDGSWTNVSPLLVGTDTVTNVTLRGAKETKVIPPGRIEIQGIFGSMSRACRVGSCQERTLRRGQFRLIVATREQVTIDIQSQLNRRMAQSFLNDLRRKLQPTVDLSIDAPTRIELPEGVKTGVSRFDSWLSVFVS